MALTDFNHTRHATVDERGDVDIHYYKNTSEDVQIEQSVLDSNANIPPNDHNLLSLLKDLSSFAFKEKLMFLRLYQVILFLMAIQSKIYKI